MRCFGRSFVPVVGNFRRCFLASFHEADGEPILSVKPSLSRPPRRARRICRTARRVYLRFKGESLTALALFYAFCPPAKRIYNLLFRNKPLFLRVHYAGIVFIRLQLSCRNFYAVCSELFAAIESIFKSRGAVNLFRIIIAL